jgi:hypothetical protein
MVNIDPREPGDDVYEQYTIKKTYPILSDGAVTKGHLYTFNDDGYIVPLVAVAGAVTLHRGVVQATVSVPAKNYTGRENAHTVQCHVAGSWVILEAGVAMPVQSRVVVQGSVAVVTPNRTGIIAVGTAIAYVLGTIHEVLTQSTEGVVKTAAAIGDKIVVQMGVSG